MKLSLISLLLSLFFIGGCSGDNNSILSKPVQKDPGALTILNPSGFMGQTVAGTSIDHVLTIKANGGLSLKDITVTITTNDPISFKDGSYPGTGGTCATTLESGETCTIVLIYEPVNTNSHVATVKFNYEDKLKSYEKTYQVSADSYPILSFEYGTLYDFSNKFVGTSTDLRIRISNTGKVVAQNISVNNLGLPFSMKGGNYPGIGGTCGNSLSPGQTCDIYVNYSPTNNGEHFQNITLNYFNTGRIETSTLRLIAWGFYQAQLTVSDSDGYDYGTVAAGATHDKIFTITHSGGDVSATSLNVLNLSSPFSYKGGTFPGTGGSCTRTLTKETGSCRVVVSLNSETSGTWNNTITFSYFNGTHSITLNRSLSAITRQRARISFSPSGIHDFGAVTLNTSGTQTFTITYLTGELPASSFGFSTLSGYFNYTGGSYPGTGGTCGATLISGSCTISLTYRPTIHGDHTLVTDFNYSDAALPQKIPLTLKGRTETKITNTSAAFGNVVNGQTKDVTVTLNSTAGNGITGLSLSTISSPYSFKGGNFPGTNGTCTGTLAPSSSCTIVLSFSPVTEGAQNGALVLSLNGGRGATTHTLGLTGTGTPAANITIPNTDFGSTSVNSAKEMIVRITNTSSISPSSASWSFPSGFGFKGGNFPGSGGNCWSTSCNVVLVFTPTLPTTYSGTLTLTYNDGTGNIKNATASLTGSGFLTDDLFLSGFDTVSFLPAIYVGESRDYSFTLSHGGDTTPAFISSKIPANSTDYSIINDTCPASLNNGASCTFKVRFSPKSSGIKASSFSVNYDNGVAKTVTRLVTGSGVNPGLITPTPSSLEFGTRATDATYELTIGLSHSGSADASTFTRTLTGSGFSKIADTCTTPMNSANKNCTVTILFSPTLANNYSGNLALTYWNGFTNITTNISLSGTGSPTAVLSYSTDSYDFGDIIQTQTSTRTITVNHSGPVAATNLSTNTLSPPYSFKGGTFPGTGGSCTDTLSTGNCTMVVDFSPTSTGIKKQDLNLSYNNGTTSRTIKATLTGESLAQAIISISNTNPYNFGITNLSGSIDESFTLSNSGSVTATGLTGIFDLPVFSFKGGTYPGTGGNCGGSLARGSSCTIVLNFKPAMATTYSGSFTLNYYDGLRTQSEYKNLTGTGSNSLQSDKFLSLLSEEPFLEEQRVFIRDSSMSGEISTKEMVLYTESGHVYFRQTNHLFPDIEGLSIQHLDLDKDKDGINDFLFSIQGQDSTLKGYSIRSGKNGHVLERYLSP